MCQEDTLLRIDRRVACRHASDSLSNDALECPRDAVACPHLAYILQQYVAQGGHDVRQGEERCIPGKGAATEGDADKLGEVVVACDERRRARGEGVGLGGPRPCRCHDTSRGGGRPFAFVVSAQSVSCFYVVRKKRSPVRGEKTADL